LGPSYTYTLWLAQDSNGGNLAVNYDEQLISTGGGSVGGSIDFTIAGKKKEGN
jgi:hypothetical protein